MSLLLGLIGVAAAMSAVLIGAAYTDARWQTNLKSFDGGAGHVYIAILTCMGSAGIGLAALANGYGALGTFLAAAVFPTLVNALFIGTLVARKWVTQVGERGRNGNED